MSLSRITMALHFDPLAQEVAAEAAADFNVKSLHPDRGDFFVVERAEAQHSQIQRTLPLGDIEFDFTYEGPDRPLSELQYLFPFFSGFGGIKDSSGPFSKSMAMRDLGLLTIDPIRRDDRSHHERLFHPHRVQVEAVEAAIEHLHAEEGLTVGQEATRLILIGHSMGGEPTIEFAEKYREQVAAVILMATIGFGSPNVLHMLRQIPGDILPGLKEEMWPFLKHPDVPKTVRTIAKAAGYFILNPERTAGEVGSCLSSDLRERTNTLVDNGVPVIYGQPVHDALVRGGKQAAEYVSSVSEIERAGHMIFQAKPERAADWIVHCLQTLELVKVD